MGYKSNKDYRKWKTSACVDTISKLKEDDILDEKFR